MFFSLGIIDIKEYFRGKIRAFQESGNVQNLERYTSSSVWGEFGGKRSSEKD